MTESKREYDLTKRMPRHFEFEDGPTLWRNPIIHIVGGAVLTSWSTEGDGTVMVYRQTASDDDPLGRGVYVLTREYESVPTDAGMAIAQTFTPDEITGLAYIGDAQEQTAPIMLLCPFPMGMRRPGKN